MPNYDLREAEFAEFFETPFRVYPDVCPYVSPMRGDLKRYLDERRNPLFKSHGAGTFFTVLRDGQVVGRIAAHVHDDSNQLYGLKRGYFGFFDCADDPAAAYLLIDAAERWAQGRGCTELAGNFNLTAMQQMGVVTDGFTSAPFTDMQFNPPHIPYLLELQGYSRFFPMSTWEVDLTRLDPESLVGDKEREWLADPAIHWVPMKRSGFRERLAPVREILNEGFAQNPMFVPLTEEEFLFQAAEMMWIVDERIATLAMRGNDPAGVVICIPDLNPFMRDVKSRIGPLAPWRWFQQTRRRKRALLVFAGVMPDLQGKGLSGAMLYRAIKAMQSAGYETLGITWVSDDNVRSLRQVEKLGGTRLHRLHLYRKSLQEAA